MFFLYEKEIAFYLFVWYTMNMAELNLAVFGAAFSGLCTLGISVAHLSNPEFDMHKNTFLNELNNYDSKARAVFAHLLSESFLTTLGHDQLRYLNNGLINYASNFSVAGVTYAQTAKRNMQFGKVNFVELIKTMTSPVDAKILACIPLFLDKLTQTYVLNIGEDDGL